MKTIFIFILLMNVFGSFAQITFEPQILILTPNKNTVDDQLQSDVNTLNQDLKKHSDVKKEAYIKSSEFKSRPENVRKIIESEFNYSKNLDAFKLVSLIAEQHLSYVFFEKFPNLIVQLSEQKSTGELPELQSLAEQNNFQYVLNFSEVAFFKSKKQKFAKITIELYDHATNKVVIKESYVGDWSNPGFEFACEEESINCTINNALSQALSDIVREIANNNSSILKERKIQKEREDYLLNQVLNKKYDPTFLANLISNNHLSIDPSKSYQCILNEDQTMFVAFFVEKKQFSKEDKEKNVNIISSSQDFSNIPDNYGYVLNGLKFDNKWYFEKNNFTYFEAENSEIARKKYFLNLIEMNYFKENSSELNPDFWSSNSFEKIESAFVNKEEMLQYYDNKIADSNDPKDIQRKQDYIAGLQQEDEENKDYIGMYQLVADHLKLIKEKEDSAFYANIKSNVLDVYFNETTKRNGIVKITAVKSLGQPLTLIFPKNKSVLLAPIVTEFSGKQFDLNYLVLLPVSNNQYEIYKWTYFNTSHPKSDSWVSPDIVENLETLTKWNYSYEFLNDSEFWSKYVLQKENGKYKYLEKLK